MTLGCEIDHVTGDRAQKSCTFGSLVVNPYFKLEPSVSTVTSQYHGKTRKKLTSIGDSEEIYHLKMCSG